MCGIITKRFCPQEKDMKKQILGFASVILCCAVLCTVFGAVPGKKTVASAKNSTFAAGETAGKTNALGGVAEVVSGINSVGDGGIINGIIGEIIGDEDVSAGIGGFIGGVAEDLSGIVSGFGNRNKTSNTATTAGYYEIETITPVVTEEKTTLQAEDTASAETETTAVSTTYGLTVEDGATEVPYEKPTLPVSSVANDGVRWMQWIFIYTDYGLRSDGITGVLDDDTVSCIKRLQQESGLKVDGELTEETINEIENLYLEKKLQGNAEQTSVPSEVTEAVTEPQNAEKSTLNTVIIVVLAIGVWTLILGAVLAVVLIRKKKLQNDGKKSDKKSEVTAEKKDEKEAKAEKKSNGGVESLSDLFQEAEEKSKKKK